MSRTRGEGRASGEKGGRLVVPAAARRERNARLRADEEAWAAQAGPVEVTVRTWVCDGCMKPVAASQIADFADGEHVLCKECRFEVTPGRMGEPYTPEEVADIKQIAREKRQRDQA